MPNQQEQSNAEANPPVKPQVLEEDDEFEDFPVDDWSQNEAESPTDRSETLWVASWEDDEEADLQQDFSRQLKEELKKVEASA